MNFRVLLITLGLTSTALFSSLATAKPSCSIDAFQPVDITPSIQESLVDKQNRQVVLTQQATMRCANITFSTAYTRNRVAHTMAQSFEATYFDGKQATSRSVTFNEDELRAGYIKIGPRQPRSAYVCFTKSETPINIITCDID